MLKPNFTKQKEKNLSNILINKLNIQIFLAKRINYNMKEIMNIQKITNLYKNKIPQTTIQMNMMSSIIYYIMISKFKL